MQLVIDASTLVAEAIRVSGRVLLRRPALDLYATLRVVDEATHELGKRFAMLIQRGLLDDEQAVAASEEVQAILAAGLKVVPDFIYARRLSEAYQRIPRDPDDAPSVALALALGCGIWTADRDFFGCGLPVWSTDVIRRYLEHEQDATTGRDPTK